MLNVFRLVRGKFSRHFRMWLAETAGRFDLLLRVIAMFGGFSRCSGWIQSFPGWGKFLRRRALRRVFGGRARATAAATSTTTTATAVAGGAGGGGRF